MIKRRGLTYLAIIFLVIILIFGGLTFLRITGNVVIGSSSITANSSNYIVGMFGTGMATAISSSGSYSLSFLSETKGTTRNAEGLTNIVNVEVNVSTSPSDSSPKPDDSKVLSGDHSPSDDEKSEDTDISQDESDKEDKGQDEPSKK